MKFSTLLSATLLLLFAHLHELNGQQTLSLEQCYTWAEQYYPLAKQKGLNQQYTQVRLDIIEAEKKPTLSWNAQASIQSEALEINFPFPGVEGIELPPYRAQTTLDAGYLLYDGGLTEARKAVEQTALATNNQLVEVELYQIKERIDQYFWGLVLLDVQDSILMNAEQTLAAKKGSLEAAVEHGVVLPAQLKKLEVEQLKLGAERESVSGKRNSLIALLSEATGQEISREAEFVLPELASEVLTTSLERPEQTLFEFQKQQILSNSAMLDAKKKPKLSAFLQAGVGYPNPLNFVEDEISPFAIGGLKFSWNILDWGATDKQKQALQLQAMMVETKKETFEFNLNSINGKYKEDIAALEKQLQKDRAIFELQQEILEDYGAQLENGVITATDYTTQLNEGISAQLQLRIHELQIQQLKSDYLTKMGR